MNKTYFNRNRLFPFSFNVLRRTKDADTYNPTAIFDAEDNIFDLKTKTDYSKIYLNPNNKSRTKTTNLSQAITEGIVMAKEVIKETLTNINTSSFLANEDFSLVQAKLVIPNNFCEINFNEKLYINNSNKGQSPNTKSIKVTLDFNNDKIVVTYYDINGNGYFFNGFGEKNEFACNSNNKDFHFHDGNMLIPIFCTFAMTSFFCNPEFEANFLKYYNQNNAVDERKKMLIQLSENLYQMNKELDMVTSYRVDQFDLLMPDQFKENSSFMDNLTELAKDMKEIFVVPQNTKFDNSEFTEEQLTYLPKLSSEFKLPNEYKNCSKGVYTGDIISLLFEGPAGTGKTALCKLICQEINLPIMEVINCSESLDEETLGKFIPCEGEEGKIIFCESNIVKAIREGGAVVFEEINFSKPRHIAFLHSLLDDNGLIKLDNGTIVKRHKNFRFFATMNHGYAGTIELNMATKSRFNYLGRVPELPAYAIKNMLVSRIPECKPIVNKVITAYNKIKFYLDNNECDAVITPRHLESWLKTARYEGMLTAAEHTVINGCSNYDPDIEKAIRNIVYLDFKQSA